MRKKVAGSVERPRLVVFRSLNHIYAQVVNDESGETLVAASTMDKGLVLSGTKAEKASKVGERVAELCQGKGVSQVVFDRGGYLYHGRVKAVADGARKGGLQF